MSPHEHLGITQRLRQLAPTFAEWPRWTRNLPTKLVWLGIGALWAGAGSLFWRTISLGTEYALVHKDVESLNEQKAAVVQLGKDMAVVKVWTKELKQWKDRNECEAEEDYRKRHHLPTQPCPGVIDKEP